MNSSELSAITTNTPISHFYTTYECVVVKVIINGSAYLYTDSDEELDQVSDICNFKDSFEHIAFIITLVLGIPGSLLSLLTIRTLPMSTGTFYVALLSIADFFTLSVHGTFYMLERYQLLSVFVCKAKFVLWAFTSSNAQWALVLIILERFFTVCYPLQKSNYFTITRCYVSAFCLGVLTLGLFAFYYWSTSFNGSGCVVAMGFDKLQALWSYVDLAVYTGLPLPIVSILTVAIALELCKIKKRGKSLATDTAGLLQTEAEIQDQFRIEYGISLMMSFYAVFFIIMSIPVCIVIILYHNASDEDSVGKATMLAAHVISLYLKLFMHASNFIIYFLSSSRFRKQLMVLLHCTSAKATDGSKQPLKTSQEVPMYTSGR